MTQTTLSEKKFVSVQSQPCAEPPATEDCLLVGKVNPESPAGKGGIEAGDLLVEVAGIPAAEIDLRRLHDNEVVYFWRFYSPRQKKETELLARGYPIGAVLGPTGKSLERLASQGNVSYADYEFVWEAGDWDGLEIASRADLRHGMLGKLWQQISTGRKMGNRPATLMLGAALYELGKHQEGMKLVLDFLELYESNWPSQLRAIARYYIAKNYERNGKRTEAIEWISQAIEYWPLPRLLELEAQLVDQPPVRSKAWEGKSFPVRYEFPKLASPQKIRLSDSLSELEGGECLVVCLLATYRANGPYYEFIRSYRQWHEHFGDRFKCLHVITMEREVSEKAFPWLTSEKAAIEDGISIDLLLEDGSLTDRMQQRQSPAVYLLDCNGTVVYEGIPNDADIWNLITK